MKKNIYIYMAFLIIGANNINAQDYFSFYNLGNYVVQTQDVSPVYLPKNSFTFAVPVANLGVNLNSGFQINDLLVENELTSKLKYDLNNLFANADDLNDLNTDLTVNLFYMAFKRKKGSLTFFANTKATNNWRYSKDFLGILANGITDEGFTLTERNSTTSYNEFGVGFTQTFFNDRLAIAVRAKYLNGFVHASTNENARLSLEIDKNTGYYTIDTNNAVINTSGLEQLENLPDIGEKGMGALISGDEDNPDSFKLLTENTGWGFDFGATYNFTDKLTLEVAVNDIGTINWIENVQNFNTKDTEGAKYSGIDLRDDSPLADIILKELATITGADETAESFETKLNMKSYASLRYAITQKNMFTLAAFNTHAFNDFKPSYSLGYNRTLKKTTFGVLTSMAGVNNEFLFGANFAINLGPLQLYGATDSLKALFTAPEEASGANVRVGLNFVFGYNKKEKKETEELVEVMQEEVAEPKTDTEEAAIQE